MAEKNSYTSEMRMDISNLKKSMQEARRQIRMAHSEFKAATAGMDKWGDSTEGLSAKIKESNTIIEAEKSKLEDLKKQYEIVAAAEGETSAGAQNLQIKINNQTAAVRSAEAGLARYSQRLDELIREQETAASAAQNQTGKLDELKETISSQEKQLSDLKQEYASATLEFGKNSEKAEDLAGQIRTLSGELDESRTKMSEAARAADELASSMEEAEDATESVSDGFTTMKGVIANLIADGIKALAKAAVESLGEIVGATDEACKNFQAKTGASAESMEEFKEQITDLYKSNFGESMNDVANAMAEIKQQTGEMDPSVLKDMTENAMTLSDTFEFDIKEQMRAVKMLTDQFGISSEEAFNLLVQGAQKGLDKNGDLLDTINEYAVHYKQLGYSAEDFFNSLESGTAAGTFSVDKLGDAMKEFGIRSKDTATTTQEGFELLGYGAGKSEKSVKDLQKSFAAGGKKAQKATNEVMKKLVNMKDKVKQNQAGVDLFGTMWEDLGIEGVKALMKTNGTMDQTKKSMEEIKEIKYSDVKSRFEELGRTVQMDLLVPLAEKAIPKIEEFAKKAIENIDGIVAGAKVAGAVFGTAFAVKKIIDFVSGISTMVSAFKTAKLAIEGAATAQKVLNVVQAASPIGLLIAGVGALVAALITFNSTADETEEKYAGLTEAEKENREAIEEMNTAYLEAKEAREEAISGVQSQFDYYEELKKELDDLIDKNGKVKKGEKERVQFIIEKLNDALGTELSLNGDLVENYKDQKKAMEDLLKTKEAQAILSATEQDYNNAIAKRTESLRLLTEEQKKYEQVTEDLGQAEEELKKLQDGSLEGFAKEQGYALGSRKAMDAYARETKAAKEKVEELTKQLEESGQAVKNQEDAYVDNLAVIENYSNLSEALISGSQKKIKKAVQNMTNNLVTAENGNKRILDEQAKNMRQSLKDTEEAIKKGTPGVTEETRKMAEKMVKRAEKELQKFEESGKSALDGFEKGLTDPDKLKILETAGANAANVALAAIDKKLEIHSPSKVTEKRGVFFTEGFAIGITKRIRNVVKAVGEITAKSIKLLLSANKSAEYETAGSKVISYYEKGIEKKQNAIEKAIEKLIDRAVSAAKKKSKGKKVKSEFEKLGESMAKSFSDAYETAADKAADRVQKKIESLTKNMQKKYDVIKDLQDDLEKRLSSGDLYKENEDGSISLADFGSETEAIRKFGNNLQTLKKKLSAELMSEIAAMDTEDGLKLTNKLLSVSDAELKKYNDAYTQKLKASSQVASSYYEEQIKTLQTKYNAKVKKVMGDLEKQLEKIGENAMDGFIKGFNSKNKDLSKAVKDVSASLIRQIRKALGIHSPSQVMRDMVGRFIPAGIAEGIRKNSDEVMAAMERLREDVVKPMKAAVSGISLGDTGRTYSENIVPAGKVENNYNFNQEIHSPKALSRWDLYRQSKNLLEGVSHV